MTAHMYIVSDFGGLIDSVAAFQGDLSINVIITQYRVCFVPWRALAPVEIILCPGMANKYSSTALHL